MGFSRSYRASIDRIKGITFTITDRSVQDEVISKVSEFEMKILEAEKALKALNGRIENILDKYLRQHKNLTADFDYSVE